MSFTLHFDSVICNADNFSVVFHPGNLNREDKQSSLGIQFKMTIEVFVDKTQSTTLPSGVGVPAMIHFSITPAPVDATVSWRGNSNTGASMGSSSADT